MSIIGPLTNPKHSLVALPNDNYVAQPSVTDQTESALRLKQLGDVFSEAANSFSQFIITIIVQFFETSKCTLLK